MEYIFKDKNLHLALLDEIRSQKDGYSWISSIESEYETARSKNKEWKAWSEFCDDEESNNPDLEAFLLTQPIDSGKLAELTSLTLDNDRELYEWIYPGWWEMGSCDYFTIQDLYGIEQCEKLEYLLLGQGLVRNCSLKPLTKLKHLQELSLCVTGNYSDIECLTDIKTLQKLDVANVVDALDQAVWDAVQKQIEDRK
jgi:hypothetical protein